MYKKITVIQCYTIKHEKSRWTGICSFLGRVNFPKPRGALLLTVSISSSSVRCHGSPMSCWIILGYWNVDAMCSCTWSENEILSLGDHSISHVCHKVPIYLAIEVIRLLLPVLPWNEMRSTSSSMDAIHFHKDVLSEAKAAQLLMLMWAADKHFSIASSLELDPHD